MGSEANRARAELESSSRSGWRPSGSRAHRQGRDGASRRHASRQVPAPGHSIPFADDADIISVFRRLGSPCRAARRGEDYYNFEALNFPPEHPRATSRTPSTSSPTGGPVLRTHTSPIQIRTMERMRPPVRIIAPGASTVGLRHHPLAKFHQVEAGGGPNITMADLKGLLTEFCRMTFGRKAAAVPSQFLPLHRAFRRSRYPVRHLRRGRVPRLQELWMAGDPRCRHGRSAVIVSWITTRRNSPASPSAWGSSGSRCCGTGSPTSAYSSKRHPVLSQF